MLQNGLGLKRGDHICAFYSSRSHLVDVVADFIVDGLRHRQRSWFITSGDETDEVRAGLRQRGVDVEQESARGSLSLIAGDGTYLVHGSFDPERAIKTFNDAIEQSYADGFIGFRAVAEMSWAFDDPNRAQQLIVYEALLRTLFSTSRAIGLCLYHRHRTPIDILNGALATHPLTHSTCGYFRNPFYDPSVTQLSSADPDAVAAKLGKLETSKPFDS